MVELIEDAFTTENDLREGVAPAHERLAPRLTKREKGLLRQHEMVIERALRFHRVAAESIHVIWAQKLWRDTVIDGVRMKTFTQYCNKKWHIAGATARQWRRQSIGFDELAQETGIKVKYLHLVRPVLTPIRKATGIARAAILEAWKREVVKPGATERTVALVVRQAAIAVRVVEPKDVPEAIIDPLDRNLRQLLMLLERRGEAVLLDDERRAQIRTAAAATEGLLRRLLRVL